MQNIIDAKDLVFEYYNYNEEGEVKDSVKALNGGQYTNTRRGVCGYSRP